MTKTDAPKPLRADALRNRDKILVAARAQFAEDGPETSLNEVARRAGVGAGTLYRHFPTREALVAASYASEIEALGSAADDYLATLPPEGAMEAWCNRFLEFAVTKRGFGEVLHAIKARGDVTVDTGAILDAAMDKLLAAGQSAGTIRPDVDTLDVLNATSGIWRLPNDDQFAARARRLMTVVLAGLRPD